MRLDRSLVLLLVSVWLGSAPARAADSSSQKVLQEKGLTKSGTVYLIEDEKPVLEKLKEVKAAFAAYAQVVERQAEQQQAVLNLAQMQLEQAELQQELNMMNQQINSQPRVSGRLGRLVAAQNAPMIAQRNQMQAAISQMSAGQRTLKAQLPQPKDKAALEAEAKKKGDAFKVALTDLRPMVDDVTKKYADLEADASVVKAKHELQQTTHTNIKLGPSDAFKAAARYLDQAERQFLGKRLSAAAKTKTKTKANQ